MTDREYMIAQAPLRAAWLDPNNTPEVREQAHKDLLELVAKATKENPPITGVFHYTDEDVKEAKKHGF